MKNAWWYDPAGTPWEGFKIAFPISIVKVPESQQAILPNWKRGLLGMHASAWGTSQNFSGFQLEDGTVLHVLDFMSERIDPPWVCDRDTGTLTIEDMHGHRAKYTLQQAINRFGTTPRNVQVINRMWNRLVQTRWENVQRDPGLQAALKQTGERAPIILSATSIWTVENSALPDCSPQVDGDRGPELEPVGDVTLTREVLARHLDSLVALGLLTDGQKALVLAV